MVYSSKRVGKNYAEGADMSTKRPWVGDDNHWKWKTLKVITAPIRWTNNAIYHFLSGIVKWGDKLERLIRSLPDRFANLVEPWVQRYQHLLSDAMKEKLEGEEVDATAKIHAFIVIVMKQTRTLSSALDKIKNVVFVPKTRSTGGLSD